MGGREKSAFYLCLLFAFGMVCVPGFPAGTEDPPQEKAEQNAQQEETAPPAGSLAAAASRIKLQSPGEEGSGATVISDQNVKTAGKGAAVSQGSGAVTGSATPSAAAGQPAAAANANAVADELQAQRVKVQNMEAQLADYDRQLAEPSPDPHYPKVQDAPQFRSPGVVDPAQGKRDQLAQQLEQERAKLQELEKKAKQAGVKEAEPIPPGQPTTTAR